MQRGEAGRMVDGGGDRTGGRRWAVRRPRRSTTAALALVAVLAPGVLVAAVPAAGAPPQKRTGYATPTGSAASAAPAVVCGSTRRPELAKKLAADIRSALAGRRSTVGIAVTDPATGVTCRVSAGRRFDSASVVKVTILATLLRMAQDQHRSLTRQESARARSMITKSDNTAASALWREVGRTRLQRFLGLAKMKRTVLGPGGYWGLTQITGNDELALLALLDGPNTVLDTASRGYALTLMSEVVKGQRWGVPEGVPAGRTVHVKNGWLLRSTHGWRINSIGSFTGRSGTYAIVVLCQDNPTMAYGITTVERVSRVVHRDLNAGQPAAAGAETPAVSADGSDETLPELPDIP
jgi:beta-lactamase class A